MIDALVLGARGMLGQTIVRTLSRSSSLALQATAREATGSTLPFDAEDEGDSLRRLFARIGPVRYVINCIGVRADQIAASRPGSLARASRVDALSPPRLGAVAAALDTAVIHVSTDGVFGPGAGVCDEARCRDATDAYGKTKSLGEVARPRFLTLRCSLVGPDAHSGRGLLEWFRRQPPS